MSVTLQAAAVAVSGSPEVSLAIKATILVSLGLAATLLAPRARAATRHVLLTTTFGALLALPVALVVMPHVTISVPVIVAAPPTSLQPQFSRPVELPLRPTDSVGRFDSQDTRAGAPSWSSLIRVSWGVGALLFLVPVGRSVAKLRRIRRHALPWPEGRRCLRAVAADAGVTRFVDVLLHESLVTPVTYGVLRPTVLLPLDAVRWPEADIHRALAHELEHVRRGDWMIHLVARATCAIYWFHPFVWTAWRHLCLEAERTCDDAVLQRSEGTAYAEQLVQLARRVRLGSKPPALAMAGRSDLSARVRAILDTTQLRGRPSGRSAVLAVTASAVVLLTLAPLRAVSAMAGTGAEDAGQPAEGRQSIETHRAAAIASTQKELDRLDRMLFAAAKDGDVDRVTSLIASGADVNAVLYGDGSPLIGAARRGRLMVAQRLLDAGADPNLGVDGDGSPLIMAAANGHIDIVTVLLARGASIDQIVHGDENALIQASANGRLAVVQLLVDRGADIHARVWVEWTYPNGTGEWRTALSQARQGRHAAVVAYLQSAGAQ